MWLNRFAKLVNVNSLFCCFLMMYHTATPTIGYLLIEIRNRTTSKIIENINKTVGIRPPPLH